MESKEMQRVRAARRRLVLDRPWYGSLSLRFDLEEGADIPTACTDGATMWFNPEFTATLTDPQMVTLVAHEVGHPAFLHPWRAEALKMDHYRANQAGDYKINEMLEKDGFTPLPEEYWLRDTQYDDLSFEQTYHRMPKREEGDGPGPDGGNGCFPGPGEFTVPKAPPPGQSPKPGSTETDWIVAVQEATNAAKKFGHAPAGIDRMLEEARKPKVDNRALFMQFIRATVPSDYTWQRPNRRYLPMGMYLPGMLKEGAPGIGTVVDTSGSMGNDELGIAQVWFQDILDEIKPEYIEVIYADSEAYDKHVEMFRPGDQIRLHPKGGGGTAFQPGLDYFSAQDNPPACVVYLTDLEGPRPEEPDYPVLWATTPGCRYPAPFGELVRLDE